MDLFDKIFGADSDIVQLVDELSEVDQSSKQEPLDQRPDPISNRPKRRLARKPKGFYYEGPIQHKELLLPSVHVDSNHLETSARPDSISLPKPS